MASDRPRALPRFRTLVLVGLLAAVPAFAATGAIVRLHRDHWASLAAEWAARAEEHLAAGQAVKAAEAYRTALSYSRENAAYQLRLAQALAGAGRTAEARAYLLTLAGRDPSHGAVNLELARLAARAGDVAAAVQHYHRAIDGYWPADGAEQRRAARVELATYLLDRGEQAAAVAELMALAAALPADAGLYIATADRLAAAGAHGLALDVYRRSLELQPDQPAAMLGAARAASAMGDYRTARRYLAAYRRAGGNPEEAAALRATLDQLSQLDAREPQITIAERARRALQALRVAQGRLVCASTGQPDGHVAPGPLSAPADRLRAAESLTIRDLRRNPDEIERVYQLALETARAAAEQCGPPADAADLALLTLARAAQADD